jgi:hypothetical protein
MVDLNDADDLPLFRVREMRMRVDSGVDDPFEIVPRAKEQPTGGMRVEDIGRCPPEEFEGFEELRREFRARELSRKPKI